MSFHEHVLAGCAPRPLASYLKALGILRILSPASLARIALQPPPASTSAKPASCKCWRSRNTVRSLTRPPSSARISGARSPRRVPSSRRSTRHCLTI